MDVRDRLAAKVRLNELTGCHEWTAHKSPKGYGRISVRGKPQTAPRVAWELERGPIPKGLCVLHRCDNPGCVNLEHLFLGTQGDNSRDKVAKGRQSRLQGIHNPRALLTPKEVLLIRQCDLSLPKLSRILGVSISTVHKARTGVNWKTL